MSKPDVRINRGALRLLLLNPKVRAELERRAQRIAAAANGGGDKGYRALSSRYGKRARAAVVTTTGEAVRDSAENNSLVKSLDAGR